MTPAQPQLTQSQAPGSSESERRTYRGRDLAEVLPKIRAELGADAVVTCQREGLVGGIRGFFAQRFIEVEAMAAPRTSGVDVYDGDDADPDTAEYEAVTLAAPAPVEDAFELRESFMETLDGVVAVDTGDGFAARLAAAATAGPQGRDGWGQAGAEREDPFVFDVPLDPPVTPARPHAQAERAVVRPAERQAQQVGDRPSAQASPAPKPAVVPSPPPAPRAERPPAALRAPQPASLGRASRFVADTVVSPDVHAHFEDQTVPEWFAGECREARDFLVERGMSARLAEDLVGDARTHDLPFAGAGGMRDALCVCIARRLPRHRGLPREGALIATIGGGGSGKTRTAAAIAASYQGASALDVRAVVLGRYDSGAELSSLVGPLGVTVQTAERGSRAAGDIATARRGVLVVADTPAVSPADPAGIGMLAVELAALAPEEVLVTLSATSNANAARQLLKALAPLSPSGIVVTHVDETDQLGTAIELSLESGLPLVYIHDGLDLPGALAPADPAAIAERLLA